MRYFLDPFGCVKNQVDAENMMAHLNEAGWQCTADSDSADLIIVNSCGFIESAKQESINAVLQWRKNYPDKKIILSGCLSQRYAKELPEILPEADDFFGVGDPSLILRLHTLQTVKNFKNTDNVENTEKNSKKASDIFTGERPLLSLPGSAYVKISEGCSNNCSYCAIPVIRGKLVSRKIPDILEECRMLLARGIKELCIIGQDIGAYGMDLSAEDSRLPELLNAISAFDGDFWVRLLYIHPDHFPLQVLDLMERDSRFLPYFDIPFQHASEKILTAMNRNALHQKSAAEKYLELIKIIRKRLPDAIIRSTFLLGFPGETEEDFSALLDFQQEANLDWLGCFAFSREEGTAAHSMKGRVSSKTAQARKQKIEELQIPITEKNIERFIERFSSRSLIVLIEEQISGGNNADGESAETGENIWLGRLYCQAPDIDGAAVIISSRTDIKPGTLIPCKITARRGIDLEVTV
jgi:ribosomal protein S12 methylthiotransferase